MQHYLPTLFAPTAAGLGRDGYRRVSIPRRTTGGITSSLSGDAGSGAGSATAAVGYGGLGEIPLRADSDAVMPGRKSRCYSISRSRELESSDAELPFSHRGRKSLSTDFSEAGCDAGTFRWCLCSSGQPATWTSFLPDGGRSSGLMKDSS